MKTELCAASTEALYLANQFPFDSIELCQHLEDGGLTPSSGMLQFALEHTKKEIHVLVRPRVGNFVYSQQEKNLMLNEMEGLLAARCHGIVVGALREESDLDLHFMKQIRQNFSQAKLTFHRAFDEVKNKKRALEELIALNFDRILTSGSKAHLEDNMDELKDLIVQAGNKIEIVCGGGITAQNVSRIIQKCAATSIHFSGTVYTSPSSSPSKFDLQRLLPSEEKIKAIFEQIG